MPATFTYFGEEFSYSPEFPAFEYAEFQEALADDEDSGSHRGIGVALRYAVACVAKTDRARFRAVSRKNGAKPPEFLKVAHEWVGGDVERPTSEPGDSSSGLEATPAPSASPAAEQGSVLPIRPDMAAAMHRSAPPTGKRSATG